MKLPFSTSLLSKYFCAVAPKSVFEAVWCHSTSTSLYCYSAQSYLYKMVLFLFFHYNTRTVLFVDITAADFPSNVNRFFLSYNVYSVIYNIRVLFSFVLFNKDLLYSITNVFPSANWYEREVWDMFGVYYIGHPDMRRILTDYGFYGNPLRKDFPLSGFIELHYNEHFKCVLYKNVNLIQDYRCFSFDNP